MENQKMKSTLIIIASMFLAAAPLFAQDTLIMAPPPMKFTPKAELLKNSPRKAFSTASTSLPLKLSYQGLLTNTGGSPVADGLYNLTFDLYDSLTAGVSQWSEAHAGVSVTHGTFSVILGVTTPLNLQFNKPLFVQVVATGGPAGPTYPLTFSPRSELSSAPYALAPWVTKGTDIYYNNGPLGIGSTAPESSGIGAIKLDIADEDGFNSDIAMRVAANGYPIIHLAKSNGTLGTKTSAVSTNWLGSLEFDGYDGSTYQYGAAIYGYVDSIPRAGRMPTALSFYTSNEANGPAERLHLGRNGDLAIDPWAYNKGALSPGLTFGSGYYTGEGIASKRSPGGNTWGLDFYTAFKNRLSITNQGNVGIGISTPAAEFQVNDSTNSIDGARISLTQAASGSTMLDGLALICTSPDGYVWNYENGPLLFGTNNLERLRIDSAGNVGIGTNAPTQRLQVSGGNIQLDNNFGLNLKSAGSWYGSLSETSTNDLWLSDFEIGNMYFATTTSPGSASARITITGAGNVGVGIGSPQSPLTVQGISNWGVGEVIGSGTNVESSIGFRSSNLAKGALGTWILGVNNNSGPTNAFSLYAASGLGAGSQVITALTSGNIGIGTTAPAQKLSVSGNICYTGTIGACSDIRYKKEITPLSGSLEKVTSLKGVNYYWRTDEFPENNFSKERQIGLIAQEVEKIYPEVVQTDRNGYKSVDYGRLTPVLIESIKELNARNTELESRLTKLESLVNQFAEEKHKEDDAVAGAVRGK